jgi:CheY-like chemotaxis protein
MPSRLLLIDDDTRLTTMVGDYLRRNGYEVDTPARWPPGASACARRYDALLLDLMLPDGDGLDLTRELRADPRTRRLPLLMLTARGEPTGPHRRPGARRRRLPAQALRAARTAGAREGAAAPRHARAGPTRCCASAAWRSTSARARPAGRQALRPDQPPVRPAGGAGARARPRAVARPDHGRAQGPPAGGLRPQHRRAHLAHPRRDRGRPQEPASGC